MRQGSYHNILLCVACLLKLPHTFRREGD